jgi:uncharacterized membrane protein YdcZ (DUF606 family)
MLTKNRIERFARIKQRLSYVSGLVTLLTVPLLLIDLVQRKLVEASFKVPFWFVFIVTVAGLIALGWLLDHYGLIAAEQRYLDEQKRKK